MINKLLPVQCPSCGKALRVTRFHCPECATGVEGDFPLPPLARLNPEEQEFVLHFVKSSGSLKQLARGYGVSYPTVRNRLDALIDRLKELEAAGPEQQENGIS
ncbi:MAG: DUF2089 domain-containing protein [Candidatus Hydrogenedentes bacterium]|nr:DUF2089 domain-containing protein [Candidatus Hydrogenedentota bacterium]